MVGSRISSTSFAAIAALLTAMPLLRGADGPQFPLVSVCDLVAAPETNTGKLFSMRVEVTGARRVIFIEPKNPSCGRIPWAFPSDEDVRPKPRFKLLEDENLTKFKNGLSVLVPPPSRTPGKVFATVEGRFDSVYRLEKGQKVRKEDGFGHLGLDEARFVLHRVFDVDVQPGTPKGAAKPQPQ